MEPNEGAVPTDAVEEAVSGALAAFPGLALYDLEVKGSRRGRVVAVMVDKAGGVTVEDCAKISEAVSAALDEADPIAGPYRLDVSSPGLERTLRTSGHMAAAIGELVTLKRRDGEPLRGILESSDEAGIDVVPDGGASVRVAYGDIVRARTVLDWRAELRAGNDARRRREPVRQGKTT